MPSVLPNDNVSSWAIHNSEAATLPSTVDTGSSWVVGNCSWTTKLNIEVVMPSRQSPVPEVEVTSVFFISGQSWRMHLRTAIEHQTSTVWVWEE